MLSVIWGLLSSRGGLIGIGLIAALTVFGVMKLRLGIAHAELTAARADASSSITRLMAVSRTNHDLKATIAYQNSAIAKLKQAAVREAAHKRQALADARVETRKRTVAASRVGAGAEDMNRWISAFSWP